MPQEKRKNKTNKYNQIVLSLYRLRISYIFVHLPHNHTEQVSIDMRKQFLNHGCKLAGLTGLAVVTHYQLELMENHQHLFVCVCVDRCPLRGDHRLSGSHLMGTQGFDRKSFHFSFFHFFFSTSSL